MCTSSAGWLLNSLNESKRREITRKAQRKQGKEMESKERYYFIGKGKQDDQLD